METKRKFLSQTSYAEIESYTEILNSVQRISIEEEVTNIECCMANINHNVYQQNDENSSNNKKRLFMIYTELNSALYCRYN